MRDAFGGVTSLVIIVVFLVLVSGYLAFNVSYTKAFRVKNRIISLYEQYEGKQCFDDINSECNKKIVEYMNQVGYNPGTNPITITAKDAEDGGLAADSYKCYHGYCAIKFDVKKVDNSSYDDMKVRAYYKIITQIEIDIPILNKIIPYLRVFTIAGDTKPIVIGR